MHKLLLHLSLTFHTGVDYFANMALLDLKEFVKEAIEIGKKQRVRISDKNRR